MILSNKMRIANIVPPRQKKHTKKPTAGQETLTRYTIYGNRGAEILFERLSDIKCFPQRKEETQTSDISLTAYFLTTDNPIFNNETITSKRPQRKFWVSARIKINEQGTNHPIRMMRSDLEAQSLTRRLTRYRKIPNRGLS